MSGKKGMWTLQRRERTLAKWTPERRLAASVAARKVWDDTPEDVREERAAKYRTTYFAHYPERAPAFAWLARNIAAGLIATGECDKGCGSKGQPMFQWDPPCWTYIAWRCYPCRADVAA